MARSVSKVAGGEFPSPQSALSETASDALQCSPRSMERPVTRSGDVDQEPSPLVRVGRYEFADCIAQGGMATVHFARLHGDFDFSRIVAIKRLLPHFARDEQFKAMFVEEARLAARISHPNVVSTLDVVADRDEVILVMDYVHGDSLSALCRHLRTRPSPIVPLDITSAILSDVLRGLSCAHLTTDKHGKPLNIVHCDVSPQNVLVGADGVARVLDFGIAKATNSLPEVTDGVIRGKPGYMAPEQLTGATATPESDLFAVGVVLWELLTGRRLFGGGFKASLAQRHQGTIQPPSVHNPNVDPILDTVTMRALALEPRLRYRDAAEMMRALELACPPARPSRVADWVEQLAANTLAERGRLLNRLESNSRRKSTPIRAMAAADWITPDELRTDSIPTARSLQTLIRKGWLRGKMPVRLAAGGAMVVVVLAIGKWVTEDSAPSSPVPEVAVEQPSAAAAGTSHTTHAEIVPTDKAEEHTSAAAPSASVVAPVAASAVPLGRKAVKEVYPRPMTRPNCSPPYTIDSAGRKHYRAECFR